MKQRTFFGVVVLLAHLVVRHPAAGGHAFGVDPDPEGMLPPRCWVLGASLKNIGTDLPTPAASYTLNGRCEIEYSSNTPAPGKSQQSTFDKVKVVATIVWTAQGNYQPTQKNTWEDITLQETYVARPGFTAVGTLTGWMICAKDPWREPDGLPCGSPGYKTGGTVDAGISGFYARYLKAPQTSNLSAAQRAALKSEYDAAVKKAQQIKAVTSSSTGKNSSPLLEVQKAQQIKAAAVSSTAKNSSPAFVLAPTVLSVVSPAANQVFTERTPIPIRVTSPKSLNAAGYLVTIETKNPEDPKEPWRVQATIPVGVADAQSAKGYTGFGAGAPPAFLALPGSYRLNAQVSSPKQSAPSAWVVFSVQAKK